MTTSPPSRAERLDRAIDEVLLGTSPGLAAAGVGLEITDRGLLRTARSLHDALRGPLLSPHFESRLAARLAADAPGAPWILRHPGRLIVSGALGSAVGVGVTAFAVWRTARRAGGAHRMNQR